MGAETGVVEMGVRIMGDVLMGLVVLAFFVACVGYVGWCGRIIGPDPADLEMGSEPTGEGAAGEGVAVDGAAAGRVGARS